MDSMALLRMQLEHANNWLEGTLGEPSEDEVHAVPAGAANPIGVCYAHAVLVEDMVVNSMLRGSTPLFASVWEGKNGLSEPMPTPGPEWPKYFDWTRGVRIDLPLFRRYAQAVYRDANAYLDTLTPEDLDREVDLGGSSGTQSVGWILSVLLIGHLHDGTGELAAAKGLQGLGGYPTG